MIGLFYILLQAPEVMEQDHGYDFKADIWSSGITAIEMATGTAPYHKYPPMKVLMLTLQNDPPNLDTGADERDQYKAYGKTFRKMIAECLQKEPSKRPTASELLKHPFFKKSKDRKYLVQTLLASGPSMETRVNKAAKRQPGASGRLHRTVTGEWVWSSEEEDNGKHSSDSEEQEDRPMNRLDSVASDSENEDGSEKTVTTGVERSSEPVPPETDSGEDAPPINLVLRMRNQKGELHDIRFEFAVGKDSADGIAAELVEAGLVDARDTDVMAKNLKELIDNRNSTKTVTFLLVSAYKQGEPADEKALICYAQISITD